MLLAGISTTYNPHASLCIYAYISAHARHESLPLALCASSGCEASDAGRCARTGLRVRSPSLRHLLPPPTTTTTTTVHVRRRCPAITRATAAPVRVVSVYARYKKGTQQKTRLMWYTQGCPKHAALYEKNGWGRRMGEVVEKWLWVCLLKVGGARQPPPPRVMQTCAQTTQQ